MSGGLVRAVAAAALIGAVGTHARRSVVNADEVPVSRY
jgi:hypothetical protein